MAANKYFHYVSSVWRGLFPFLLLMLRLDYVKNKCPWTSEHSLRRSNASKGCEKRGKREDPEKKVKWREGDVGEAEGRRKGVVRLR